MLVTHVINRFAWSGGAENQLATNLSYFADQRIEHRVVSLFEGFAIEDSTDLPAVDSKILFVPGEEPGRRDIVRVLRSELEANPTTIVHATLADAAFASRVVRRSGDFTLLESLVNVSHEKIRTYDNPAVTPWKLTAHRLLDGFTMRSVDHFHALTQGVADSWVEKVRLDRDKITVIPRGVDLSRFDASGAAEARSRIRGELRVGDDTPIVLTVGRQEPQKGQRYLIQALPRIRERFPDAIILLAGRWGNATMFLAKLIDEMGLTDEVRLLGPRPDVSDLLYASDVFAFPSLFEGLGVALLEAMAAERPCVVTAVRPLNEVIENNETGLTAQLADPDDLATQIVRLLEDRGLGQRLGKAARERVEHSYTIQASAAATEALYARLGNLA